MPTKPVQPQEALIPLPFAFSGLDVASEYASQPPGTTAQGINCRGYEPGQMRQRGGSRPGLSKYINGLVGGAHVIQHLNVIVDPQAQALPLMNTPDGILGGADPINGYYTLPSGILIRYGGTGLWLSAGSSVLPELDIFANSISKFAGQLYTFMGNEFSASGLMGMDTVTSVHLSSAGAGSGAAPGFYDITPSAAVGSGLAHYSIVYVTGTMTVSYFRLVGRRFWFGQGSGTLTSLSVSITTGNLLVVGVQTEGANAAINVTVTDSLGNTYTQIGGYIRTTGGVVGSNSLSASLWYCVSAFSGTATFSFTPNHNSDFSSAAVNCFTGASATPFDATSNHTENPPGSTTYNAGTPALGSTHELLVAFFAVANANTLSSGTSFTGGGAGPGPECWMEFYANAAPFTLVPLDISIAVQPTITATGGLTDAYTAIGATFFHM